MSYSQCLVGNVFTAQCKERPSWKEVKTHFTYFIIRLKCKACCKIKKEINQTTEGYIIRRLKRAFITVLVNYNSQISSSLGELRCDFCSSSPSIKNRKHAKHIQPPFNIDRVAEHPLICFENNIIEHEPYAEIEPTIFAD